MTETADRCTVFVADDDEGLVRLIERALRREGCQTAAATSGSEAVAWLADHHAHLLLLDLKLKDLDGREVITRLGRRGRQVPFIVITGQGDEQVAVEMMKRGALDYLVKDANFLELLPTVVRRTLAHLDQQRRLAAAEEAARESQALTQAVLDALPAQIAVLDAEGKILTVNLPWQQFARAGGGPCFSQLGPGLHYLEHCREAARRQQEGAAEIAATIEDVLSPARKAASVEYRCVTEEGERWFAMTATPLSVGGGAAVIAHMDVTDRKHLEAEVLQISEKERQRVAADLHDGICQELTGIGFVAGALHSELERALHPVARQLRDLERSISEAVAHTRQVARGLNAVVADGHGLMHALEQLAGTTSKIHRIHCVYSCPRPVTILNPLVANELYRIAQEALANAARHAGAKNIRLKLAERAGGIHLSIQDDGKGMPADRHGTSGMGLRVMKYRASLIRGQLSIRPRKGGGTEVACAVPQQS